MKIIPVQFPVDKGIPVPAERGRMNAVRLMDMEIGDSILFPDKKRATVQSRASRVKADTGRTFTIRRVDAGWCRVWRIT